MLTDNGKSDILPSSLGSGNSNGARIEDVILSIRRVMNHGYGSVTVKVAGHRVRGYEERKTFLDN